MLAVRLFRGVERDTILMLVRSYLVDNPFADNWTILTYVGKEKIAETVWKEGALPHILPQSDIARRDPRDILTSLREPNFYDISETLLARDPLGTMRNVCQLIKPGPYQYCHVNRLKDDRSIRVENLYQVRWRFQAWRDDRALTGLSAPPTPHRTHNPQDREKGKPIEQSDRPGHRGTVLRHARD